MDRPVVSSLVAAVLLHSSLLAQPALSADGAAVAAVIAQAEQKQAQAREQEHAWSVTNDYIAEARRELDAGNIDAAAAAAGRALKAADASLQQASSEAAAWQARVPGN